MKEKRMDAKFRSRMRRRLYYGDLADLDKPSFPLTEMAVNYIHDSAPEKLDRVDLYTASDVIKRNSVSPCSMVLSMLYAKRLRQRNKEYLQSMSSSDVFFISMMMASKYLYDEGVDEEVFNDEWADNTDQDVDDVNKMEIDYLQAMDWGLFVRPEEFEETLAAIERRLAWNEGLKRGWFTYSELDVLLNKDMIGMMWSQVGSECSRLMTAMSAAYVTSLLGMLGSTALAVQVSGFISSATIALFTLHSSTLMAAVSSGLPLFGAASLSTSHHALYVNSGVRVMLRNNTSLPEGSEDEADDILEEDEHLNSPLGSAGWKQVPGSRNKDGMESILIQRAGRTLLHLASDALYPQTALDDLEIHGSDTYDEGNQHDHQETDPRCVDSRPQDSGGLVETATAEPSSSIPTTAPPSLPPPAPPRTTKSSIWSIWFLDSLLSQLWAVASFKPKISQVIRRRRPFSASKNFAEGMASENLHDPVGETSERQELRKCKNCQRSHPTHLDAGSGATNPNHSSPSAPTRRRRNGLGLGDEPNDGLELETSQNRNTATTNCSESSDHPSHQRSHDHHHHHRNQQQPQQLHHHHHHHHRPSSSSSKSNPTQTNPPSNFGNRQQATTELPNHNHQQPSNHNQNLPTCNNRHGPRPLNPNHCQPQNQRENPTACPTNHGKQGLGTLLNIPALHSSVEQLKAPIGFFTGVMKALQVT